MSDGVVSPKSTGIHKLKDTGIARYVEFPEDTFFMESMAQNAKYKPGVAFVPAQRMVNGKVEMHVYTMTATSTVAEHYLGPISVAGTTHVSVFGSALSSDGILWLCAFNRNSVIGLKLDTPEVAEAFVEIPNMASPNDVCIDNDDESVLYVVGGTFRTLCCCYEFSNSAHGQCFKVQLNDDRTSGSVSVHADSMKTLAGVEKIGNTLWLAELFQMKTQDLGGSEPPKLMWKGLDETDNVWLADNVDTMGANAEYMICPAYSTVPESLVKNVMSRTFLTSMALFYYQVSTACMKGENFAEAIKDPEVCLTFSNTYIQDGVPPAPVRLILVDSNDQQQVYHFEVDLEETRQQHSPYEVKDLQTGEVLGKRHFFNEQVTHAGHIVDEATGNGFITCISFEQPRVLLLNDAPFLDIVHCEA
eukprot:Nitzschia sp. Nitz4//scaffold329_size19327//7258//8508//NITZ4_008727-RA/size19327-processed-gene-0.15-mRNA-1//-1//CDS//3329547993//6805//frame0